MIVSEVSEAFFDAWLAQYPRPLKQSLSKGDPQVRVYIDRTLGDWPEGMVASVVIRKPRAEGHMYHGPNSYRIHVALPPGSVETPESPPA